MTSDPLVPVVGELVIQNVRLAHLVEEMKARIAELEAQIPTPEPEEATT